MNTDYAAMKKARSTMNSDKASYNKAKSSASKKASSILGNKKFKLTASQKKALQVGEMVDTTGITDPTLLSQINAYERRLIPIIKFPEMLIILHSRLHRNLLQLMFRQKPKLLLRS